MFTGLGTVGRHSQLSTINPSPPPLTRREPSPELSPVWSLQPMGRWLEQELLQRNALAAHEQLAPGLELLGKGFRPRKRLLPPAAFAPDGGGRLALVHHEIHSQVPIPPIVQF